MSAPRPESTLGRLVWLQENAYRFSIQCNDHRTSYQTVEEYFEILECLDPGLWNEIDPDIRNACVRTGQVVEVCCYLRTPVSNYTVVHDNLEQAVDCMFDLVCEELYLNPYRARITP